jgi:hypothetical protein
VPFTGTDSVSVRGRGSGGDEVGSRTAYRGQRLRLSLAIRAVMVGTSSAHISSFFARSVRLIDVQNHNSGLFRFHSLSVTTSYPSSQWSRFSS